MAIKCIYCGSEKTRRDKKRHSFGNGVYRRCDSCGKLFISIKEFRESLNSKNMRKDPVSEKVNST